MDVRLVIQANTKQLLEITNALHAIPTVRAVERHLRVLAMQVIIETMPDALPVLQADLPRLQERVT